MFSRFLDDCYTICSANDELLMNPVISNTWSFKKWNIFHPWIDMQIGAFVRWLLMSIHVEEEFWHFTALLLLNKKTKLRWPHFHLRSAKRQSSSKFIRDELSRKSREIRSHKHKKYLQSRLTSSSDISPHGDICNFLKYFSFLLCRISLAKISRRKEEAKMLFLLRKQKKSCVRFFKFPSKRRREEKNNFIISAATCVKRKKCSERFQGFLNIKKIFKYIYVLQYFSCCCRVRAEQQIRTNTIIGAFLYSSIFFSLFLVLRHPATVFCFARSFGGSKQYICMMIARGNTNAKNAYFLWFAFLGATKKIL